MNRQDRQRLAETFRYLRERVQRDRLSEEDCRRLRSAVEAALSEVPTRGKASKARGSRC